MREQVIQVVEQYIAAVRHNDASALPLHPDAVCEFIPFAEHIHVANGQIVSIRGYYDPRPMLAGTPICT